MVESADRGALLARLRDHDAVVDAWDAKSFTDRLVVLELDAGASVPRDVRATLADHGFRGSNAVYDTDADHPSFAGTVGGVDRHRFVDTRTRGDHQSYVVE
ncbi:hypothetical protein [Halorarius halobius]|uniref:hypothetical protein n=1 Tax=Halorarius halobius TaxID=2962671 RepID=UPI0020CECEAB|nr:hypothetical protein [Halorarius halobius]